MELRKYLLLVLSILSPLLGPTSSFDPSTLPPKDGRALLSQLQIDRLGRPIMEMNFTENLLVRISSLSDKLIVGTQSCNTTRQCSLQELGSGWYSPTATREKLTFNSVQQIT